MRIILQLGFEKTRSTVTPCGKPVEAGGRTRSQPHVNGSFALPPAFRGARGAAPHTGFGSGRINRNVNTE